MTEEEAKQKHCPFSQVGGFMQCQARLCMAWKWDKEGQEEEQKGARREGHCTLIKK